MPCRAPRTMTAIEQRAVLRVTAKHARDNLWIGLALGTGLRVSEIVGLNVGEVFLPNGVPRSRVHIGKHLAKGGRAGDVFIPDQLARRLKRLWAFKRQRGESLEPWAPLLCSQSGQRLSKRRLQFAWHSWQRLAGIEQPYSFHSLRHTAITNLYRATHDLFLAQRFARHASPLTTTIYTHPSDEEAWARVRGLPC